MPFIHYQQPDSMDCGPTCLRMIARHYGKHFSLQSLREKSQIGKEGVSLLGISDAAESIGFRTVAAKLTMSQLLKQALLPAILYWDQNHFVVLYKAGKNTFFIADPAKGLMKLSRDEFRQHWINDKTEEREEGVALLLEPTPAFATNYNDDTDEGHTQPKPAFRNIFRYLLPHKKLAGQLLLGLGIGTVLQLFLPFLTQSVVDVGVNTSNLNFVYIILVAQLSLFAGRLAVDFVRSWILLHVSTRINLSILTDFLVKLMRLPVSFFDSKKTGDIMQRLSDHSRIEQFLTGSSLNIFFSLVNLVVFSFVLAFFHLSVFIVFILASVLYTGWIIVFMKKRKQIDYQQFEASAKENGLTIQMIQGMQEIKLNGVERSMRWSWERVRAKLFRLSVKKLTLEQWQQSGAFFINEGKNIFITFLSAKAVIEGQMTLGTMLAVQYIAGQLNSPVQQMLGFMQSWQQAKISMDRLNEIHSLEDEEPASRNLLRELPPVMSRQLIGGKEVADHSEYNYTKRDMLMETSTAADLPASSAIVFHNVSFSYPGAGNEPVLKNIDLIIPKGKTTAIVGVSGSGKTTLLKLLLKFYEPHHGTISLGNTSLSAISHTEWRRHCGTVMQESFIFSDSIARNIAVGQEKINMQRLQHAADAANIREFIESLPLGYNTKIGAEGNGISMGQKQRILIARAIYRNPDYVFFDEATNSLDANNEMIILDKLADFFHGRTVIVVAHRLSTVKNADQIIVLNQGCITEMGKHEELIGRRGEYYTLVKNQLELGQ